MFLSTKTYTMLDFVLQQLLSLTFTCLILLFDAAVCGVLHPQQRGTPPETLVHLMPNRPAPLPSSPSRRRLCPAASSWYRVQSAGRWCT